MNVARHMRQTVTIAARAGVDAYGDPAFADPASSRARYEQRTQLVRNEKGEEVVSSAQVLLPSGTAIEPGSKIAYQGKSREVIAVEVIRRLSGAETHRLAFLGG